MSLPTGLTNQTIDILQGWVTEPNDVPMNDEGICGNLAKCLNHKTDYDAVMRELRTLWISWEHYSGMPVYPIITPTGPSMDTLTNDWINRGCPKFLFAMLEYTNARNKWIGEYGSLRLELCKYLIKCLEEEL